MYTSLTILELVVQKYAHYFAARQLYKLHFDIDAENYWKIAKMLELNF